MALLVCSSATLLHAQVANGSIRGTVGDKDFDGAPLPLVQVLVLETNQLAETDGQGNYLIPEVAPGTYTLTFSKSGYVRVVRGGVLVSEGQLAEVNVDLAGDFEDLPEFIVQDVLASGGGSESALIGLRFDSPQLLDSIGADLISRAGASDAAGALNFISGATVQDGKFAVIRGLPDRYVSSQLNGVRLPSADAETRAVELDQFPSAVIESVQVSKTFTPDQQADASGGAVDVRLKGIPEEDSFSFKTQLSYNDQVSGGRDFLSYKGGGLSAFGNDNGNRDIQPEGQSWSGAVGVSREEAPIDYKWSAAGGGRSQIDDDVTVGGFVSVFYERDSSYFDNGVDDSYWVDTPGGPLVPETDQGSPQEGEFITALFDVEQGNQSVQWGVLGTGGIEFENNRINATVLHTRTTDDQATIAEDTRGKEYFFQGYDPNDPTGPGNSPNDRLAAPFLRTQTLQYTERTTESLQLSGEHTLDIDEFGDDDFLQFKQPVIDWTVSRNESTFDQPDKRQFGARFIPSYYDPVADEIVPDSYEQLKGSATFTLGNLQRIFRDISEEGDQISASVTFPFEQWSGEEGSIEFGLFRDSVERDFNQESYSNFADPNNQFLGSFDQPWSNAFPFEDHPITGADIDVDYDGEQDISSWYYMVELPVSDDVTIIGGARYETTELSTEVFGESESVYFPTTTDGGEPAVAPVDITGNEDDVNASLEQDDILPALGVIYTPTEEITLRASYSETVARPTFRELTPILQQEFLGGPIFIGNTDLDLSAVTNYDLRADYRPTEGSLFSVSWFKKDIDDPIEFIQRFVGFSFTQPVNYQDGQLSGWEIEARQELGELNDELQGLSLGANATFIDSRVELTQTELTDLGQSGVDAVFQTRDATGTPDFLYNIYATYDIENTGTQVSLFWTVKGDTLLAGAGVATGNFVPNIYAKEFGTLNLTVSQDLSERTNLRFQARNLTNPRIQTVYRSDFTNGDTLNTSFTQGRDFSMQLTVRF